MFCLQRLVLYPNKVVVATIVYSKCYEAPPKSEFFTYSGNFLSGGVSHWLYHPVPSIHLSLQPEMPRSKGSDW